MEINELGGREYSDDMAIIIYTLSIDLKKRDHEHGVSRGLVPSMYMKFYTKSAGILVEAAMMLTQSAPGGEKVKSFFSWLKTLTGLNIVIPDTSEKLLGLMGPQDDKVALEEHTIKS